MGIVILDTETTAHPEANDPIEIAYLVWEKGEEWQEHHFKMKTSYPILPCATVVHGQTAETIRDWPEIQTELPKAMALLQQLAQTHIVTGWNITFDVDVLNGASTSYLSRTYEPARVMDLMRLARKIFAPSEVGNFKLDTIYYATLPDRLGNLLSSRSQHSALVDVRLTKELLHGLVVKLRKIVGKRLNVGQLFDYVQTPMMLEEWPMGKRRGDPVKTVVSADSGYAKWFMRQEWAETEWPDLYFTVKTLLTKKG